MKKYITILLLLLITTCLAQPPVLNTYSLANPEDKLNVTDIGAYSKDFNNERDQYVGSWQYNQGGVLFQIKLEKVDKKLFASPTNSSDYYFIDIVSIKYRLVKNGIEIFNNLNVINPEFLSRGTKRGNSEYLYCHFIDYTGHVSVVTLIKRLSNLPNGTPRISFELSRGAYYLLNEPETYLEGQDLFSVPKVPIIMTKIN